MEKELVIKGMHCDACVKLIGMEIEDLGYRNIISEIKVLEGEDQGIVRLHNVNSSDVEKIIIAINNLDQYKVLT